MATMTERELNDALESAMAMSKILWTYFKSLVDLGFSHDEALALAMAFQAKLLGVDRVL